MFFVQFDVFDPVTCTHDANLVTAGQLLAEIIQIISIFYDVLKTQ